jgi:hypothetical protein
MKPLKILPTDLQLTQWGLDRLARQDWDGLLAMIAAYPPETAYKALRLLGDAAPMETDIGGLLRLGTTPALTLAGALLHCRAVRIRGLDQAENVTEDQWEFYIPTLHHAQERLMEATERDPLSGLAAAWRATTFVDSSEEDKDSAEIALRAARNVPVSGLLALLGGRSRKWGGSHEEMWRVAHEYARSDTPGSLSLIAKAHYEELLWLELFEEDPALSATAGSYFKDPAVLAELSEASSQVLATRDHDDPRNVLLADNWFAYVFYTAGQSRKGRQHLQAIGGNFDRSVWLVEDPETIYNLARLKAWLLPA